MKKLLSLVGFLIIAGLIFQISGCTKAETPVITVVNYPIEGLWIGTYTVDGQDKIGPQYFSIIIKPDGSIVTDTKWQTQQHLALGTWTLNGTILNCSFTCVYGIQSNIGITETATAIWDKTGKLVGTWKNISPNFGTGIINLTRIN